MGFAFKKSETLNIVNYGREFKTAVLYGGRNLILVEQLQVGEVSELVKVTSGCDLVTPIPEWGVPNGVVKLL